MSVLLLCEDDPHLRTALCRWLEAEGLEVDEASGVEAAGALLRERRPDVVLTDHDLPDGNSLDVLRHARATDSSIPVVVLTGHASIELAVQTIKDGAEQFLTKPVDRAALLAVLRRILSRRRGGIAQQALRAREAASAPDPFVGGSAAIRELEAQARRIAEADGPALIVGETGSGKGVLARWLHRTSRRASEPFVDLNCAGLSGELLENELFGHARGAFTGADIARPGLLQAADRGILFLDEIGELDARLQPRLLKVLEEQRFRPLGDVKDRVVDVRLIAATNRDLSQAMRERRFREDLYFRLNVLPLRMPPLRERREDIPALAARMLQPGRTLAPEAVDALVAYSWPGNVRELRNVLERAQALSSNEKLSAADLRLGDAAGAGAADDAGDQTLRALERRHIAAMLRRHGGNVARAAKLSP